MKSLQNWQGPLLIMGVDWGDSGKGRLIDDLSNRADFVARFAGGSNTGHTVENRFGKFALHIIPSGIFSKAKCVIGKNVALDLESLIEEMCQLDKAKISYKNLSIDEQASLTMPWHQLRDGIREKFRKTKIGTTGKGVGPTYADRTERVGLLFKDLYSQDFKSKLIEEVKIQNEFFKLNLKSMDIYKKYQQMAFRLEKFVAKTSSIIQKAVSKRRNVLFEGAQGYFLDLDGGTYPYVTSSNTGIIGVSRSFDIHPSLIANVVGITKAYITRVGSGPMPTRIEGKVAKKIIDVGKEFGTTTGRVRDPGWLDTVLLRAAKEANQIDSLAVTKLDVLSHIAKIKICTEYKLRGKKSEYIPHDYQFLENVKPIYKELKSWSQDISMVREFEELPKEAKDYIYAIEQESQIPVKFISVGPKRGQVIWRE